MHQRFMAVRGSSGLRDFFGSVPQCTQQSCALSPVFCTAHSIPSLLHCDETLASARILPKRLRGFLDLCKNPLPRGVQDRWNLPANRSICMHSSSAQYAHVGQHTLTYPQGFQGSLQAFLNPKIESKAQASLLSACPKFRTHGSYNDRRRSKMHEM